MEEFILNDHSGLDGPCAGPPPEKRDFARSSVPNQRAYAAESPARLVAIPSACPGSKRCLNAPYILLHPPGPSAAGQPVFLTWMLRDSIPDGGLRDAAGPSSWSNGFASLDRLLDEARTGPLYLRQSDVALMAVQTARAYGSALRQYDLHSFVVMPNHIHLLLTPRVELVKLTRIVKSIIARRANELLHQPDTPFWDEENWEHLVGDNHEFGRIRQYIEGNPVPVGIARVEADYPYSSAAHGRFAQSA